MSAGGGGGGRGGSESDSGGAGTRGGERARADRTTRIAAKQRRLERTVARLRPCLPELPPILTRVLVLRAGVGSADPLSRRQVARRIDRPVKAVRRYERRGVRRLRQAVRTGECAPASALPAPDGAGVPGGATTTEGGDGATVTAGAGAGGAADGAGGDTGGNGGGNGANGDGGGVEGVSDERGPIAGIVPRPPSPTDLTVPILLVLLGGMAAGGLWAYRRREAAKRWPERAA